MATKYEYNPIRGVREHSESDSGEYIKIPKAPSKYQWALQDLSKKGAGRTENNVMKKMRVGQLVKITLEWRMVSTEDAAIILQAFNPEYLDLLYLSPYHGTVIKGQFYVGDRNTPIFSAKNGVWEKISFALTEVTAEVKSASDINDA